MPLIWPIVFMVFLVVEGVTTSLTSIWSARGFLATLMVQVGGGDLYPQLAVSMAVSFMLFLIVRPFVYKCLYSKRTSINVDSLTGREAVVREHIDNMTDTGSVILVDGTWLARAAQEGDTFETGDVVIIPTVSGAKLLVAVVKQKHEVEKV